jgi:hypothetical protein
MVGHAVRQWNLAKLVRAMVKLVRPGKGEPLPMWLRD